MRDGINVALERAVEEGNKRCISTLRLIKATIRDRDEAARGNGGDRVSDDGIAVILVKMIKQRVESSRDYEEAGQLDLAQQELEEQPQDPQAHGVVHIARRLVGQQNVGTADHGPGDGQALLFPAGQRRGQGVHAVLKTDPAQQLGHVLAIGVGLGAGDPQGDGGVVEGAHMIEQVEFLEDQHA